MVHSMLFISLSFEHFGKPNMINPDVQRDTAEVLLTGRKCSVDHTLRPEFIRLAPPLHIAEDEVGKSWVSILRLQFYYNSSHLKF